MPSHPSTRGILSGRNRFFLMFIGAIVTGISWGYYKLLDSPSPKALAPRPKAQNAVSSALNQKTNTTLRQASVHLDGGFIITALSRHQP